MKRTILVAVFAACVVVAVWWIGPSLLRTLVNRQALANDSKANRTIEFYGCVVNQDGDPLSGAQIRMEVEAFRTDNYLADPNARTTKKVLELTTNADGRFSARMSGSILRVIDIIVPGHEWVRSDDRGRGGLVGWPYNDFYQFGIADSVVEYEGREDNPAVFVMLRDGKPRVAHVMMCRGGNDYVGGRMVVNLPFWPSATIPHGVTFSEPAELIPSR